MLNKIRMWNINGFIVEKLGLTSMNVIGTKKWLEILMAKTAPRHSVYVTIRQMTIILPIWFLFSPLFVLRPYF